MEHKHCTRQAQATDAEVSLNYDLYYTGDPSEKFHVGSRHPDQRCRNVGILQARPICLLHPERLLFCHSIHRTVAVEQRSQENGHRRRYSGHDRRTHTSKPSHMENSPDKLDNHDCGHIPAR